ncbi:MAG: hypothetical protein GX366_06955 [Epulopiscium sp.]|nr:hypothetical protein [Candidatus Epulonipiscium sp.]
MCRNYIIHYSFYTTTMLTHREYKVEIDENLVRKATYGIITVGNPEYNMEFAELCIKYNVPIVFGMKCDSNAFPDHILKFMLENSEIIFMNDGERKDIEKRLGYGNIKDLFCDANAKCIVVTKGSKGSQVLYLEGDEIKAVDIKVVKPNRIVDTAGVGDAYIAGFMYGYFQNKGFIKSAQVGSVFSSFIIEEMGCLSNIPTKEQVNQRYKTNYGGEL